MTTVPRRLAAGSNERPDQRTQVGDEAVLAHDEPVELARGGPVLILKCRSGPGLLFAEQPRAQLIVNGGEDVAPSGEEATDGREAVSDVGRCGLLDCDLMRLIGQTINAYTIHSLSSDRPQLIA